MIFFTHSQGTILSANAGRRQPPQGPCDTANFEVCTWIYLPGEFHLHLARFVPRSSAGAVNFQAYLLDGITRWNLARATAAVQHHTTQTLRTFNSRSRIRWTSRVSPSLEKWSSPVTSHDPILMTRKYACDESVVALLCSHALGNSPTALRNTLHEFHSEEWLWLYVQFKLIMINWCYNNDIFIHSQGTTMSTKRQWLMQAGVHGPSRVG